jgi:hypothetical protein
MPAGIDFVHVALQGYRQLKLMKGPKNVTCFVEFEDVETAMAVHTSQQV